jgi:hypothetical protein
MATYNSGGPAARSRSGPNANVVVVGLVFLLIVLLGLVVYAVTRVGVTRGGEGQELPFRPGTGTLVTDVNVSLSDLAQRPRRYVGTTVSVDGNVGRVLNDQAFTLRREGLLDVDAALVVIPQRLLGLTGPATILQPGSALQVRGVAQLFDPAMLERDIGVAIDRGFWNSFQNIPVLVAELIQAEPVAPGPAVGAFPGTAPAPVFPQTVPRGPGPLGAGGAVAPGELTGGPIAGFDPGAGTGAGVGLPVGTSQFPAATIDQIVQNPQAFVGRPVTVAGAMVQVIGQRGAVLMDLRPAFSSRVLVVSARPLPNLATPATQPFVLQDNIIRVAGTVELLDLAAVEQQLGLALDPATFRQFVGQPVIVAREVTRFAPVYRLGASPEAYTSTSVSTAGWIESIIGTHAFALRDPDRLQPEDVLVVSQHPLWTVGQTQPQQGQQAQQPQLQQPMQPFIFQGNNVQVTGVLHPAGSLENVHRQLGIPLDQRLLVRYAERPVLVASSITPL